MLIWSAWTQFSLSIKPSPGIWHNTVAASPLADCQWMQQKVVVEHVQGALVYWLTSSCAALGQQLALRAFVMRSALGLPARDQVPPPCRAAAGLCDHSLASNYQGH